MTTDGDIDLTYKGRTFWQLTNNVDFWIDDKLKELPELSAGHDMGSIQVALAKIVDLNREIMEMLHADWYELCIIYQRFGEPEDATIDPQDLYNPDSPAVILNRFHEVSKKWLQFCNTVNDRENKFMELMGQHLVDKNMIDFAHKSTLMFAMLAKLNRKLGKALKKPPEDKTRKLRKLAKKYRKASPRILQGLEELRQLDEKIQLSEATANPYTELDMTRVQIYHDILVDKIMKETEGLLDETTEDESVPSAWRSWLTKRFRFLPFRI